MGMPKIEFRIQLFRGDWDQIWSQLRMLWLMEALVRCNQIHLQEFEAFKKKGLVKSNYPSVYRSGLHYETEKNTEIWPDIPSLLSGTMGTGVYSGIWGDCEDLACYRTAELRELPFHHERPASWDKKKTEYADPRFPPLDTDIKTWKGWKKVKGGIAAKPFAKWRRGPQGNYHYHALTLMPDGRLEDPSLVLGMGREAQFNEEDTAQKLKDGTQVILQYATAPDVMVLDPEKPSGYAGGKAPILDKEILSLISSKDDLSMGAYLNNEIESCGGKSGSIDALIGFDGKQFVPYAEDAEIRRLLGYQR